MKNFLIFLTIVFLAALVSCEKDEIEPLQPRNVEVEILPRTAAKIIQAENDIHNDRSTNDPSAYDSLATYWTNEVWLVLQDELPPAINLVVGKYDEFWRDKSPKYQSKVWVRLDVGVNADVYRCCEVYSEKLLLRLRDYCLGQVNGSPEWTPGTRDSIQEVEIINLFIYDSDPMVEWQYKDRLYDYFHKYAENENNKAGYKRKGFLNFGAW